MPYKILVTGGSGLIGSQVATQLSQKNFQVSIIDKTLPSKTNFPSNINCLKGDLTKSAVALRAVLGQDMVVHLAANIGPLQYMSDHQAEILQENCAIDVSLYPAMIKQGVKIVIYSSSSMVFQKARTYPYKESDLNRINPPTNVYGLSKLVGEYFCRSFHQQYGLDFVILRYHNVYGPGEIAKGFRPEDIHVIPALIEKVLSGQYPLQILGDPQSSRPFTFLDDAVAATIKLIEAAIDKNPQVLNQDFNIGPRKSTPILDLAKMVWSLLGDNRPFKYVVIKNDSDTAYKREMDPQKINQILNWQPTVSLEDGIIALADWMKSKNNGQK